MKRVFVCLAAMLVLSMSIAPAYAAAEGEDLGSTQVITVSAPDVYVTVQDEDPVTVIDANDGTAVRSQLGVAMVEIFGEYSPRTQTVTTYLSDGTAVQSVEVVPGLAGLDWVWLSSVGLFALFLFCLMRLMGGAVK
mgnify:CR=1 FL=1